MGVRYPSVSSNVFIGPLPANNTETVVCTTPALTLPLDSAQVMILWRFNVLAGTGTTAFQLNVRRGTTTGGTLIGPGSNGHTIAAGNAADLGGSIVDQPGAAGGLQYSLTIIQIGATAAGTPSVVSLIAFAL